MKIASIVIVLLVITCGHLQGQSECITLSVEVTGAEASAGQAILSLFGSKDHYLKKPTTEMKAPVDGSGSARFTISNLKRGRYAVSVIHDADLNGKLNTGLFGIPTELVGFSNNATSRFGPPSFEEASFVLNASQLISIRLGRAKKD